METKLLPLSVCSLYQFLPYLWGMETSVESVTVEFVVTSSSYRTYEEWKRSDHIEFFAWYTRSYRTYEEWKHKHNWRFQSSLWVLTVPMRNGNRSTSLIIKPIVLVLTVPMRNGNKVEFSWAIHGVGVLTVPMRNGNSQQACHLSAQRWVLTVPMRNGNAVMDGVLSPEELEFLPYLWGMETWFVFSWFPCEILPFLPYLWGMETLHSAGSGTAL